MNNGDINCNCNLRYIRAVCDIFKKMRYIAFRQCDMYKPMKTHRRGDPVWSPCDIPLIFSVFCGVETRIFFELCRKMMRIGKVKLFRNFFYTAVSHFKHNHCKADFRLQYILMRRYAVYFFENSYCMLGRN